MADSKDETKKSEIQSSNQNTDTHNETELNDEALEAVTGGLKKLPGKKKPPTLTLK